MGLDEAEVRRRVDETLALLGIVHLRSRSPLKLSGGEKRLAAIASVLSMGPSLMLFDEPTAFLDPKARRLLQGTLRSLPQAKIIATHDLSFAADICTRMILLHNGRIAAEGRPEELIGNQGLMEECGL
jgi:cobalt/nickel transport system ATP-binding protein